jgi:hypothetical protein
MNVEQLLLEVFKVLVIQIKPSFQRPIGHTPLALEQVEDLGEKVIEGHGETLR